MASASKSNLLEAKTKPPATAKKVDWSRLDTQIEHSGKHIILPAIPQDMSEEDAVAALQRRIEEQNTPFNVHELIEAYPTDAAVAFYKAMVNLYGITSPVATWFQNPTMLTIRTGHANDDVVQVPIGKFKLPGVDAMVNAVPYDATNFLIHATVKKKHRDLLVALAVETRRLLREESIYRGKAIALNVDEEGQLRIDQPPTFMDVSDTLESSLIFDDNIREQINTNILVPMKQTSMCRQQKIPLKRGILLEGPYGTGKSLTARMAAKIAEDHGWTFVLLNRIQGMEAALRFIKGRYEPALVFAEDIDRIAADRDDGMNDLINTIDGVVSKNSEIMIVLTSNHADKLDKSILRPGRLDAVISLRAPNAQTVEKLLRFYAGDLIEANEDLSEAGKELAGQIPASIRECVERAKLGMLGRGANTLSGRDVVISAQTMKNHLDLLNGRGEKGKSAPVALAESLQHVIRHGAKNGDWVPEPAYAE